jgi:hypothetical protein
MARRLGVVKRRLLGILVVVVAIAGAYWFLLRESGVTPHVIAPAPTSAIGSGSSAVGVAADGTILSWLPPPPDSSLPMLPLSEPPKQGRLAGPVLEQARVLGAAPAAVCPYIESSYYGESGVDVMLESGIELRFGDASRAAEKWRAATTVLANPTITSLDYVDLHSPGRPSVYGSGHTLPPVPAPGTVESAASCAATDSGAPEP